MAEITFKPKNEKGSEAKVEEKKQVNINKQYLYKSGIGELIRILDWAHLQSNHTSWGTEESDKYATLIQLINEIIEVKLFGGKNVQ